MTNLGDERWYNVLSSVTNPMVPGKHTFLDYVTSHSSLSDTRAQGFTPDDAVRECIDWSLLQKTYKVQALIDFGFRWSHMVCMNIQPKHWCLDPVQRGGVLRERPPPIPQG